ncbi:MAG: LuxR C-terminal-related transcriptional regulator [Sneathiella sp.]
MFPDKNNKVRAFNQKLISANSQADIWAFFKDYMRYYGVTGLNYVNGIPGQLSYFSTMSNDWRALHAEKYAPTDFVTQHCISSVDSIVFDSHTRIGRTGLDTVNQQALEDLKDFGSSCGFYTPLPTSSGSTVSAGAAFFNITDAEIHDLYTQHGVSLNIVFHIVNQAMARFEIKTHDEFFQSSTGLPFNKKDLLTEREKDVLRYLAAGLRPDRIAEKMNLKNATVNLHIQKARLRLNAKTREQALAKALTTGQLVL